MTEKFEALRLAELLEAIVTPYTLETKAAAELRRLHDAYEVSGLALDQALKSIEELSAENKRLKQAIAGGINAQLLEALEEMLVMWEDDPSYGSDTADKAYAAIKAAKGEA